MKKVIALIISVMLVGMVFAIEFEKDGEFRTRIAIYNDAAENDGGHVDNRFQLGLGADLGQGLNMYAKFEVGDMVWGNGGGGISTTGINVETYELYIDYRLECIQANVKVGQQWWADHRGLILDDTFSGIMLTKDDLLGFKTELGWIKANERWTNNADDYNVFLINAQTESPMPLGAMLLYGRDDNAATEMSNITFMPYATLAAGPVEVDLVGFVDYQIYPSPADDLLGLGAAVKATMNLGVAEVGADVLFATENGLTTISPYYQNGLYIYGYGHHHDGVNLYWGGNYTGNTDTFLAAVLSARMPFGEKLTAFGAFGILLDTGMEVNAGVEYSVIPDLMGVSAYGAYGMHDNDTNNYLLGTSLKITF
ncbi:MAG: hypothetical protein U1B83_02845 [Candidatus Cloacimonadaceae bacterium]|nr:hypothetical protein [Candidatus Cloacimonadaceae bacterium]